MSILLTIQFTGQPTSTKKYGGVAAIDCQEFHMQIGWKLIRFAKGVVTTSEVPNWNGTNLGSPTMLSDFPVANFTLTRSSMATATAI